MTAETKKIIAILDEDHRHGARMFWERIYESVVIQSIHDLPKERGPTREQIQKTAAAVADEALVHWAERW